MRRERERERERQIERELTRVLDDSSGRSSNSIRYTTGPENTSGTEINRSFPLHPTVHSHSTGILLALIKALLRKC